MQPLHVSLLLILGACFVAQPARASEIGDREQIAAATRIALARSDFAALDRMAREYRTSKSRTSSGLWKLSVFYSGLSDAVDRETQVDDFERAFDGIESRVAGWARQSPDSPVPHILLSSIYLSHAWAFRGEGFARSVRPQDWEPFRRYSAMARENLEAHRAVAAVDPRWYEVMLNVARAEEWKRSRFDDLLDEALDREPGFYQTYFAAIEYLLPKWHGGLRDIEQFARDAVRRTSRIEGQSLYARIYWVVSQTQYAEQLFDRTSVQWPSMKVGFEDVIARYPDAWNLNSYARFACLARDQAKTGELLRRIDRDIVAQAWEPNGLLESCREWVRRGPDTRDRI